jgi:flavorubredoxin
MTGIQLSALSQDIPDNLDSPTPLFDNQQGHAVYWLGIPEITAFRGNTFLIVDGDEAILVDPGHRGYFDLVKERVSQILPPEQITGMILCHQDPDVAGSMAQWLELNPHMDIVTSLRTHILLPYYGQEHYRFFNTEEPYRFVSRQKLHFIPAPFLHSPGAFATYDGVSQFLFSGDIWAALDMDWTLIIDDFDAHLDNLNTFNQDYMASHAAAFGFAQSLDGLTISAILPQHGAIIPEPHVAAAIDYLKNLRCGLDLLYSQTDWEQEIMPS